MHCFIRTIFFGRFSFHSVCAELSRRPLRLPLEFFHLPLTEGCRKEKWCATSGRTSNIRWILLVCGPDVELRVVKCLWQWVARSVWDLEITSLISVYISSLQTRNKALRFTLFTVMQKNLSCLLKLLQLKLSLLVTIVDILVTKSLRFNLFPQLW